MDYFIGKNGDLQSATIIKSIRLKMSFPLWAKRKRKITIILDRIKKIKENE